MDDILTLISSSGVVHRICRDGIYTNNIFHSFFEPLTYEISKAQTSASGCFIFFIIEGRLFLNIVTQTKIYTERIGDNSVSFIDAAFNNEESQLYCLTNDLVFHFFSIYPVKHLFQKKINITSLPVSFQYYQLQNIFKVFIDSDQCYFFKFPSLYNVNDSEFLELINQDFLFIVNNDNQNINTEKDVEQPISNEMDGFEDDQQMKFDMSKEPDDLNSYALSTLNFSNEVLERQNRYYQRFEQLVDRINKNENLISTFDRRIRIIQERFEQMTEKLMNMLTLIDKVDDIYNESKKIKKIIREIEDVLFDDVLTDKQIRRFSSYKFYSRLKNIENMLSSLNSARGYSE